MIFAIVIKNQAPKTVENADQSSSTSAASSTLSQRWNHALRLYHYTLSASRIGSFCHPHPHNARWHTSILILHYAICHRVQKTIPELRHFFASSLWSHDCERKRRGERLLGSGDPTRGHSTCPGGALVLLQLRDFWLLTGVCTLSAIRSRTRSSAVHTRPRPYKSRIAATKTTAQRHQKHTNWARFKWNKHSTVLRRTELNKWTGFGLIQKKMALPDMTDIRLDQRLVTTSLPDTPGMALQVYFSTLDQNKYFQWHFQSSFTCSFPTYI